MQIEFCLIRTFCQPKTVRLQPNQAGGSCLVTRRRWKFCWTPTLKLDRRSPPVFWKLLQNFATLYIPHQNNSISLYFAYWICTQNKSMWKRCSDNRGLTVPANYACLFLILDCSCLGKKWVPLLLSQRA